MINFIVVENDIKIINKIKKIITELLFSYDIDFKIKSYFNYDKNLEKDIKDNSTIKVYIINNNNIDIASTIRINDWDSQIIILTNKNNYNNIINVFDYIKKDKDMVNILTKDIKKIISHNYDNKTFKYNSCSNYLQIYDKSINYINRDTKSRKLIIHTNLKDYEINMTIKDILKVLDKRFIQVSKSTVINQDNINEIDYNKGYFILPNNEVKYLVSKKYKPTNINYKHKNNNDKHLIKN